MRERVASSHRCCCCCGGEGGGGGGVLLLLLRVLCDPASKQRGDRGFYGREGVGLSGKIRIASTRPTHASTRLGKTVVLTQENTS